MSPHASSRLLGSTVLGVAGATIASGANIVTTFESPVIVTPSTFAQFSFDTGPNSAPIQQGAIQDHLTDVNVAFLNNNSSKPMIGALNGTQTLRNSVENVARLPEDFVIGLPAASGYQFGPENGLGALDGLEWPANGYSRGYVGVSFIDASSNTRYGWMDLSYVGETAMYIHGLGYEDSGASVLAGGGYTPAPFTPIPEPASAGLAAALLAGSTVLLRRRRSGS